MEIITRNTLALSLLCYSLLCQMEERPSVFPKLISTRIAWFLQLYIDAPPCPRSPCSRYPTSSTAMSTLLHTPLLLSLLCTFALGVTVNISIPLHASSSARYIEPALVGLSIEQDRWTDWAGTNAPNQFFNTCLNNLRDLTGQPPWIRIGANSEDHTIFDSRVQVCASDPAGPGRLTFASIPRISFHSIPRRHHIPKPLTSL